MKPQYVVDLETYYGPPSQDAFGSAVFFKKVKTAELLEQIAQEQYQQFIGELWEDWGPKIWLGPWKELYRRPEDGEHDIVAELNAIDDFETRLKVDMILNNIDNSQQAREALSTAYNAPDAGKLRVYNIGDGEAMSGLLIAGRRENGDTTFLAFMMD